MSARRSLPSRIASSAMTIRSTDVALSSKQACLAFTEDAGEPITVENLDKAPPQYREDYADYVQCFHTAMSILALMQEVGVDGDEEFERIKLDMFSALKPVLRAKHDNAYYMLNAALAAAVSSLLTKSHVPQTTGLFDNDARKGLCHSLADTRHIEWVKGEQACSRRQPMKQLLNSNMDLALRCLLIFAERPQMHRSITQLTAIDLLATRGADFGLTRENLHGDLRTDLGNLSGRDPRIRTAMQWSQLRGLTNRTIHGFIATDQGFTLAAKLTSPYHQQYRKALVFALDYVDWHTFDQVRAMIHSVAPKSLEEER